MAGSTVSVPFNFGRQDRTSPKHAPFGVLGQVKNLRHREVGGLGLRTGYQPLSMATVDGTLTAYDLHEYSGRLLALGEDGGDGFPRDIFEYMGLTSAAWRASATGQRTQLTPFSNLREMIGTPLCEGGVTDYDAAAGGGYVCLAYVAAGSGASYFLVINAATQQSIHQEGLASGWAGGHTATMLRVCYAGGRFYIGGVLSDNSIKILRFSPATSVFVGTHVATVKSSGGTAVSAWDLTPATNVSSSASLLITAYSLSNTHTIKRWDHNGSQSGSTITVSATTAVQLQTEGDEANGTINLFTVEGTTTGQLRTLTFAGSVQAGPTTTTAGASGGICRLHALGSLAESVAVAVNTSSNNVATTIYGLAAHAVNTTITVKQAVCQSRLIPAQSAGSTISFCFAGRGTPLATTWNNNLWYVANDSVQMATRDYLKAKASEFVNLSRDDVTGQLCWPALRDPGVQSQGMPVVSLVDFQSTKRRQSAKYGNLIYFAGAPMSAYEGRFNAEAGFDEAPNIQSITPGSGGSLTTGAQYTYTVHFEYTFADGSLILGPPSVPVSGNTGDSDTSNTIVATTPHTNRVAASGALFGADVVGVLSRTVWTPILSAAVLFSNSLASIVSPLTGLTLILTVDGGAPQTVTFTAAASNISGVISEINAQTTGVTVAQVSPGSNFLSITDDTEGAGGTLLVGAGTANATLGFFNGQTAAGETSGLAGSIYRRAETKSVSTGIGNYGGTISFTDIIDDVTLEAQGALYTQAARGAESGSLEHDAPRACSFVVATAARLLTAGLSRTHEYQVSKEAYLGESFTFADFSTFFGQVYREIVGVAALDAVVFVFTRDEVFSFASSGPDDLGGGGIATPRRVASVTGLKDWRSLLETPDGLIAQFDDDKLYLIPRGYGSPTWIGQDVLEELQARPLITGAARCRADDAAMFAINDNALSTAKLVVNDFTLKTWLIDEPPLHGGAGIAALVNFGRTVAYISGGVVYLQSEAGFTDETASPIVGQLTTRPLYPFGIGGYGLIYDAILSFEFRGACTLGCRVSYDDGANFTALTSYAITGTSGASMQRKWTLPTIGSTSVVFELTMTPTGTGTEGLIFNQLDLLVHPDPGLRELAPAEMGSAA